MNDIKGRDIKYQLLNSSMEIGDVSPLDFNTMTTEPVVRPNQNTTGKHDDALFNMIDTCQLLSNNQK